MQPSQPLIFATATLALLTQPLAAAPAQAPIVITNAGPVRGTVREGVHFFGGIPFAAPPTGPLRWKATEPAGRWRSVRDASASGADCPQPALAREPHAQSEDCLTLNVVSPDAKAKKKLPVLVLIHGGAYQFGSGREGLSQSIPAIVRDGVVIVSPNYRLGRLGFFGHPGLVSEAPLDNSNYWLMDQVAALKWVRTNVARFGGDPGRVTIMGCSAGGSSINALVATPKARGLFAAASVHSGGGMLNNLSIENAENEGMDYAARVGVTGSGAEAVKALRALSVEQVMAGETGPPNFLAITDHSWLPSWISVSFATGKFARVPLLIGSTSNEASVFGLMGLDRAGMEQRFGFQFAQLQQAYGPLAETELLRQVQTDTVFTSSAMGMTQLAARAGVPAWSYHFDYVNTARRGTAPGASHCEDMRYWLGLPRFDGGTDTPEDAAIGTMLRGYLVNFLRDGNPNGVGLPHWDATRAGKISPLFIAPETRIAADFRARQLAPWFAMWERLSGQRLGLGRGS